MDEVPWGAGGGGWDDACKMRSVQRIHTRIGEALPNQGRSTPYGVTATENGVKGVSECMSCKVGADRGWDPRSHATIAIARAFHHVSRLSPDTPYEHGVRVLVDILTSSQAPSRPRLLLRPTLSRPVPEAEAPPARWINVPSSATRWTEGLNA